MKDFQGVVRYLITGIIPYNLLILTGLIVLILHGPSVAQAPDPVKAIGALKDGFLVIRMPSHRAKIDTLSAMVSRTSDPSNKARMERILAEAIEERDNMIADYTLAFKNQYQFSKTTWFFDYEAQDVRKARHFNMDGQSVEWSDISRGPVFYLHFERTAESRIDALVIYDQSGKIVPAPFPNQFSRGGINFLFLKIADKKFPDWRVSQMNKRLYKFYADQHE